MSSATSPHVFKDVDEDDINFIDKELEKNNYAMFIRKVTPEFSDEVLRHYIFKEDNELVLIEPLEMMYNRYQVILKNCFYILICIMVVYILYTMLL